MENKDKYLMSLICLKELLKRGLLTEEEYSRADDELRKIYLFHDISVI